MRELRIVFMGTPDFAVGVLKPLVEANHNIVAVITAPDKPAGRGRKVVASAVKEYALSMGLRILQPTHLKDEQFLEELRSLEANLQIVVAFRMLPKAVWAMPAYGTFNLHASLLPQYRGAAPIHWAIINGETTTGVTTFFIDDKIDTGAIIDQKEIAIDQRETVGSLHDKLMELGARLVLQTVQSIAQGEVKIEPQSTLAEMKEAPKLTPENTRIDWQSSLHTLDCFIRGLSPFPVAWSTLIQNEESLKCKIYAAHPEVGSHPYAVGTILSDKKEIKVAVRDGYLCIDEIQLPGKKKMMTQDLLNGFHFGKDAKFV
jgi:methionyl-tRNA formyltransferase